MEPQRRGERREGKKLMGLPGMDGTWAAGFIHSLPLRSPRPCGSYQSLLVYASVAQCRERRASNAEVAGESPAGSTNFPCVVQQQRHAAQNGASAGAIPAAGTISMESEPDECAGTVLKRSRLGAADHGFCPCSSAEEQPASNRKAGGATPPRDTLFYVPVAQQQSSRSITGRSKVRILPGIPILMNSLR